MSLLPPNTSIKNQKFAELLDVLSIANYSDIDLNPLTCDASLLPHIALGKKLNIENMTELEIRRYLSKNNKKFIGTRGAVEDAVNACFDEVKVIEWFEDNSLSIGEFSVEASIVDGGSIYDERLIQVARLMIQKSKNVRSKLKEIIVSYMQSQKISFALGGVGESGCVAIPLEGYEETLSGMQKIYAGCVCETSSYAVMEV